MAVNQNVIRELEAAQKKADVPAFRGGDTLRVHVKVVEGGKERVQIFEGIALSRRGESVRDTVLVRKVTNGVGVERTFLVHSPRIDRIEVLRRGRVRRAKLYYLRDRVGKAARIKEDRNGRFSEATMAAKAGVKLGAKGQPSGQPQAQAVESNAS